MKGEIDRDWYCSFVGDGPLWCQVGITEHCAGCCLNAHRKWPTPEQFKEEYGEEYSDNGAVYWLNVYHNKAWELVELKYAVDMNKGNDPIVCACTPWGKPPNDWRPE